LSLHADLHGFWLAEREDAWYGANNNTIRQDATGGAHRYVGGELDLSVKYTLWEHVWIWLGYSHFAPGSFVRDTGAHPHMDWAFLEVEVRF
jgi:hypothetical protein